MAVTKNQEYTVTIEGYSGEGAGVAAALSARENVQPRNVNIQALQETLLRQGAELGQGRTL